MGVISACPLRVASVAWQTHTGAWCLTVVAKATFRLEPGTSPVADSQDAPTLQDCYHPLARGSLREPSDLVPFKACADVLLVGSAFAPHGVPARSVIARFNVGRVDKHVEVWCDRLFLRTGELVEGRPFVAMPLVYERAAGGALTWNPVGVSFDAEPDAYGSVHVPNLQARGARLARRGERFDPAGFGPIPPRPRSTRGRRGGAPRRRPLVTSRPGTRRPSPSDVDPGCFNAAPRDQQRELHPARRDHRAREPPPRPSVVVDAPAGFSDRSPPERSRVAPASRSPSPPTRSGSTRIGAWPP